MQDGWLTHSDGNTYVHVLATNKFKMISVLAQWQCKLAKDSATAVAVIPQVLVRGTSTHPTPEGLTRAFDEMYGASVSARTNKHGDVQTLEFTLQLASEAYLQGAKGLFSTAFQLFAEVMGAPHLQNGVFSAHAVEKEKTLHKQRIENLVNDKIAYASERCIQLMCDHEPFGIPRFGYASEVDRITPGSLYLTYQRVKAESPLHVYLVGDVDAEKTAAVILSALQSEGLAGAQGHLPEVRVRPYERMDRAAAPRLIIDRMDVNQGKLNMGLRSAVSYASDDYPALIVYNGILGGFPHSKLFANVREKESLAYYASSRLDGLKGLLFIQSGIQISDYEKASRIIADQLAGLQAGDITEDELYFTKNGLINQYLQSDDQPLTGAMMQMFERFSGRRRSVSELLAEVVAVTKTDVVRVAQQVALDTVYFLRDKGDDGRA